MKRTLAAVLLALSPAAFAAPQAQSNGDAAWTCGGVGADERRALQSQRPQSNVELLFVTAKRGGYLADASFTVTRGGQKVASAESEGPMCLLSLPAGDYRIEARRGDVVRTQAVKAGAKGSARRVVFAFPDEAWDGIQPTAEEKRQAREP